MTEDASGFYDESDNPLLQIRGPKEYFEAFGTIEAFPIPDDGFDDFLLECVRRGKPMTAEERDRWFNPPEDCLL